MTGHARAGITVHRTVHPLTRADARFQLGIRATTPARALLDISPGVHERRLARLVNDALLSPHCTRHQLRAMVDRHPTHRGVRHLTPFLDRTDGPTRSEFEDRFTRFCADYGLPEPRVNVRVAGHLVDAHFPAHRLIVELDGWEFHKDRAAFESDRNRDADTLQAGQATVRITWDRLTGAPAAEAARLRAILTQRDDQGASAAPPS